MFSECKLVCSIPTLNAEMESQNEIELWALKNGLTNMAEMKLKSTFAVRPHETLWLLVCYIMVCFLFFSWHEWDSLNSPSFSFLRKCTHPQQRWQGACLRFIQSCLFLWKTSVWFRPPTFSPAYQPVSVHAEGHGMRAQSHSEMVYFSLGLSDLTQKRGLCSVVPRK